jgi:4-hydroxy-2-oxoheptanedioate aldolase
MANKLRELWRNGGAAVNGWLAIPNGFSAEVMAQAGWDSLTVDLQHGVQDYMSMVACFQAIQPHGVLPMARVPSCEPGIIGKVLDAGAYGVICPMLNTAEEVRTFVSYCKYPPQGTRSNGPVRAGIYGANTGYQKTANEEVLCIPMIETAEAVANCEAIMDVPGVDAIYIGPTDLSFSLGWPPVLDSEESRILEIFERLLNAAGKRGIPLCMHCGGGGGYAVRMLDMGFKLVTVGADNMFIRLGAQAALATVRGRPAVNR